MLPGWAVWLSFASSTTGRSRGGFDRVISVGMMEHVGIGQFDAYFGKIRSLLKVDGFALVHCIGRKRPLSSASFIRKYVFPGAYVPSCQVFAATERTDLWVADMEVLRLHYHYTLQHWRRRFAANRAGAAKLCDERFCACGNTTSPLLMSAVRRRQHGVPAIAIGEDRRGADPARLHGRRSARIGSTVRIQSR
jgi:cyclopropane fatty-acyl-phospholipid synthase-like methyltransferase